MTNIGIVGAGQDKFTIPQREKAQTLIRELLQFPDAVLVSGGSPVGGIDIWAERIADELGRRKIICAPEVNQWDPPGRYGFKARNLDIGKYSDVLHVIVVARYPLDYTGQRFNYCYHCVSSDRPLHVKSGGCWTGIQTQQMGKLVVWHVIE